MTIPPKLRTAIAVGFLLTLAACGSSEVASSAAGDDLTGGAALGTAAATLNATDNLTFDPAATTVHAGDIVEWKNSGSMPHNIMFAAHASADDTTFGVGQTWQVKFSKTGTYTYKCTLHPGMNGTVTVG